MYSTTDFWTACIHMLPLCAILGFGVELGDDVEASRDNKMFTLAAGAVISITYSLYFDLKPPGANILIAL
uniref:Ammonium_transp domain-containing protein n=1 Tax=Panagrellus redivivus TaxID=6233 RepID=A0A7E4UY68_PANRE